MRAGLAGSRRVRVHAGSFFLLHPYPRYMPEAQPGIEIIRKQALTAGAFTAGITRHKAFDVPGVLVSQSRIDPKVSSDWHHHAKRTLYGYLVQGQLRFDYGPRGIRAVEFSAGDYFRISPGIVHRDVNPSNNEQALVVAVLVGEGPPTVNTPGPDAD